ncbi:hypothetical protein ACVWW2_008459 [Bradyrhizobium sp. LM4.3]
MGQDESQRPDGDAQMSRFTRPEQTFPALTSAEIERVRQFGEVRLYADGEFLFETGKPGPGMFVVLKGHVAITQRDGLGHVTPLIDQGPPGGNSWPSSASSRAGRRWSTAAPKAMSRRCCCRRSGCARCWSQRPSSASASCAP